MRVCIVVCLAFAGWASPDVGWQDYTIGNYFLRIKPLYVEVPCAAGTFAATRFSGILSWKSLKIKEIRVR